MQINGKREAVKSKIKSAISRKSDKNAQFINSAKLSGNKQIADFKFAKERSDFRKSKARRFRNRGGGAELRRRAAVLSGYIL
jgi:hypothetical protein